MKSRQQKKVWKIADRYNHHLLHTDKRFKRAVKLVFRDGTVQFFHDSFLMLYEDENESCHISSWVLRFSEHHGFDVIAMDELQGWQQFKPVKGETEELK